MARNKEGLELQFKRLKRLEVIFGPMLKFPGQVNENE